MVHRILSDLGIGVRTSRSVGRWRVQIHRPAVFDPEKYDRSRDCGGWCDKLHGTGLDGPEESSHEPHL